MVEIGRLGACCLHKWQTQKERACENNQSKNLKKIRRAGDKRPKVVFIFSENDLNNIVTLYHKTVKAVTYD